jgi:acyl dehydratase
LRLRAGGRAAAPGDTRAVQIPALAIDRHELPGLVGADLPPAPWVTVTRAHLAQFDASTFDGPSTNYPGADDAQTVHGTYTLSLIVPMWERAVGVRGAGRVVLYGFDRVRFPAPVFVGGRVRGHFRLVDVDDGPGGVRYRIAATVEVDGAAKPACVAELVLWAPAG